MKFIKVCIDFGSFNSLTNIIVNCICLAGGIAAALALDKFNSKFAKDEIDDKGISSKEIVETTNKLK